MLPSDARVLVVAAHPDDETLGCGGTIARCRSDGVPVRVVFLAEGITARYDPPQFETASVREESRVRNANAVKALEVLGVDEDQVFTAERYCCRLDEVPLIDLSKAIEHHLRDFAPTHLLTHGDSDVNVDHRLVHQAALAAARPVQGSGLAAILAFEVLSSTEWNPWAPFPATVFCDVSETIELKIEAMRAYGEEMREPPHPRSEAAIRGLATYRGVQAGFHAAEGFALIRQVW